jgi:hypothetical protein
MRPRRLPSIHDILTYFRRATELEVVSGLFPLYFKRQ